MQGTEKDGAAARGVAGVKGFYRHLAADALDGLDAVYHPDVVFEDPAGIIRGRGELKRHFARLLADVRHCAFEFADERDVIAGDAAVLCWRMHLAAPPLAGGRRFAVEGVSCLRFASGGVVAHRDYFDLGAMLYEQLPLLGAVCRRLRRRLACRR